MKKILIIMMAVSLLHVASAHSQENLEQRVSKFFKVSMTIDDLVNTGALEMAGIHEFYFNLDKAYRLENAECYSQLKKYDNTEEGSLEFFVRLTCKGPQQNLEQLVTETILQEIPAGSAGHGKVSVEIVDVNSGV